MLNAFLTDLRNVDQTFDVFREPGKSAELGEAGDGAFHELTDTIVGSPVIPWVRLQLADGKTDTLLLVIDVDDFYLYFLPNLEDFARMLNAVP